MEVTTFGASPAAAACVRDRFDQVLPEHLEEILEFLEDVREPLRQAVPDSATRQRLLASLAAECMEAGRPLTDEEFRRKLADAERGEPL